MKYLHTIENVYGLSKYVLEIKRGSFSYYHYYRNKKDAVIFLIKTIFESIFNEKCRFKSFRICKISESSHCISYVEKLNKKDVHKI